MFLSNWPDERIESFVAQIDSLIEKGTLYKNDKTSTVSRTSFDNTDIVVKRYNNKGLFHSVRNSFRQTRSEKSFYNSCLLVDMGIYTPAPLGYAIEKQNGLYRRSYFIMEHSEVPTLHQAIMKHPSSEQWEKISNDIKLLLDKFAEHKITHGDLKHSNVLVTDNGAGILDLDVMCVHKSRSTFQKKRNKDMLALQNRLLEPPEQYITKRKQKYGDE